MVNKRLIHTIINGEETEFLCEPRQSLLEVLRNELGLTGTKEACNNGNCGACSVIMDGALVNSCLVLAVEAEGKSLTTIEGLASPESLHQLQQFFLIFDALQCGYCTPGVLVAAKALLDQNPHPSEEEVRRWMAGNLCRCTGYDKIVRAIQGQSLPESSEEQTGFTSIGSRPVRRDGVDKVTGRAQFAGDIRLPGMLYGAVLRSPHAHARILSIDASPALKHPGVKAVVTARDLPRSSSDRPRRNYARENILAHEKVFYHGHAVAAVAATNIHIAHEALALINVAYEILPPVLDVRQAMQDGTVVIHDDLFTDDLGRKGKRLSNIASHARNKRGDLKKGFAEAAVIVEREFTTSMVHQGYIEPHMAAATYNAGGQVTIWCSTQGIFSVRENVANILDIPVLNIRVVPTEIGGGFGGKNNVYLEPLAVLLSKKSGGRPVKMAMSYSDVLCASGPTSGSVIRVRMGADSNGKITAAEATLIYEAGAFPGSPVGSGMSVILTPYNIPHVQIDGYDVVVNKPATASYRAPGGSNANFAAETVIDEICEKLGMDPIEFRLLNGVREGDQRIDGVAYERIGYLESLQAARDHPHYTALLTAPYTGRGVASAYWGNYGGKSSASATINPDGTVSLVEGSMDLSGTRTTLAMQLAETLHIPFESVKASVPDTDSVGFTEGSYGSRTTFATGWAAYELGNKLLEQLKARAAELWGVEPGQVSYEKGKFKVGDQSISFAELASRLDEAGGDVVASVTVQPDTEGPSFALHIVDVQVDPETGKVNLLRYTAVQDVGKAVHPVFVEGQIQGAVAQGVGWALNEEYVYDQQGHLLNASLLDYRLPTFTDLPKIDPVIVEVPNPGHPFGVRGVGEISIVPPPAAIANAIYRAIGVRLYRLPMKPERLLEAIWEKESSPSET